MGDWIAIIANWSFAARELPRVARSGLVRCVLEQLVGTSRLTSQLPIGSFVMRPRTSPHQATPCASFRLSLELAPRVCATQLWCVMVAFHS